MEVNCLFLYILKDMVSNCSAIPAGWILPQRGLIKTRKEVLDEIQ